MTFLWGTVRSKVLTLPLPSLLVLTLFTKAGEGGQLDPPAISKTIASRNLRIL